MQIITIEILKKNRYCLYNKLFKKIQNVKNPYGDGKSAKKIIKIIKKLNLKLNTQKVNTY